MIKISKDKVLWFCTLVALPLIFIFSGPIKQNLIYHSFADQHAYFGIPNFFNVFSNISFFIVALMGIYEMKLRKRSNLSWNFFLLGILLVGPGSAYYHFEPNNQTLVWDRLPMSIGFMGLFSYFINYYYELKNEKVILFPLIFLGIFSVILWNMTDDLRLYYWVQFAPLFAILIMTLTFKLDRLSKPHILIAISLYILAKVFESNDQTILNTIKHSGHSIKHYLAALAVYFLVKMNQSKESQKID